MAASAAKARKRTETAYCYIKSMLATLDGMKCVPIVRPTGAPARSRSG